LRVIDKLSLTTRLTLLFATGSGVVLLALGWLIGASIERHFEAQDRELLTGKLLLAQHAVEAVLTPGDLARLPHRDTVDLAAEVLALFDYYEAVAEEKGLALTLTGHAHLSADRLMLRRALGNLLSNAVRHSTPGSTISVHLQASADSVALEVRNCGEPIAPEFLLRVFDRFFRVDPSRHRSSEGAGLGLAITRSIIWAHGGTIVAASSGGITTFSIRLPTTATPTPG